MTPYIMTYIYPFVCLLLITHWFGDFFFQSHWMSINKSKDTLVGAVALTSHVFIYAIVLSPCSWMLFGSTSAMVEFVALNAGLHGLTDLVTSRWSSWLWNKQSIHNFFVVIGLDQLIHQLTLITTMWWLLQG